MDKFKTDLSDFKHIKDFDFKEHFIDFEGLDMHYIDEGNGETILALHGQLTWSYLYRKFIPCLPNYRFIAPDLIGFGKSDKLKNWEDYSFELHLNSLINLVDKLKLNDIHLIVQDWGGLLGLSLLGAVNEKIKSVIILNTYLPKGDNLPISFKLWQLYSKYHPSLPVSKVIQRYTTTLLDRETLNAYNTPFRNKLLKTGPKSFPQLVPSNPEDESIKHLQRAKEILGRWTKPALVMFSDSDPIFSGKEKFFLDLIPYCKNQTEIIIKNAGHFLQEDKGEQIANYIELFLNKKLPPKA